MKFLKKTQPNPTEPYLIQLNLRQCVFMIGPNIQIEDFIFKNISMKVNRQLLNQQIDYELNFNNHSLLLI